MKKLFGVLTVVAILASFAFTLPKKETRQVKIVLDAAHGGKDWGSAYETFKEKEIAAAVSAKIKELNDDVEVVFYETRPDDTFVSLQGRVEIVNNVKPDLMISLHTNYEAKGNKSGIEVFFNDTNDNAAQSRQFADELAAAFATKAYKAEVKRAPFYVLKHSEVPAITLEMGYLSNEADRGYLTTEEGQEIMAQTLLDFVKELK